MDRVAKLLGGKRKSLFTKMVSKGDLQRYFDTVKCDKEIYFVAIQGAESSHLFVGNDQIMRFFVDLESAKMYCGEVQDLMMEHKFFVAGYYAVRGITKAITEAKSVSFVKSVVVSTYQKNVLVDIDCVYKRKQLLN